MGRTTTRLTDRQLQVAKPKEKDYVLSDGDGLQLRIRTNGSRLWNISYQHPSTKKRVNMGLGTYPEISLALARKLTIEARELLAQGIDLKTHRDQSNLQKKAIHGNSFEKVAKEWLALKEHSITPGHAEDIWRSLERYILPKLGNTPVAQITAPLVIGILKPIEAKGNLETVNPAPQRGYDLCREWRNGSCESAKRYQSEFQEAEEGTSRDIETPGASRFDGSHRKCQYQTSNARPDRVATSHNDSPIGSSRNPVG